MEQYLLIQIAAWVKWTGEIGMGHIRLGALVAAVFVLFLFQNCGKGVGSQRTNLSSLAPPTTPNNDQGPLPAPIVNGIEDLKQFPLLKNQWRSISTTNAPQARSQHVAVWTGTEMIIWGGLVGDNNCTNTGARYNPTNDSWQIMTTTNAPPGVCGANAVWTGNFMFVWGGVDVAQPEGTPQRTPQIGGIYHPGSNTWSVAATPPQKLRSYLSQAVWTGEDLIIANGVGSGAAARYSPNLNRWTVLSGNDPQCGTDECIYGSSVWTGADMIIFGGRRGTQYVEQRSYNLASDQWNETQATTTTPPLRQKHTSVWTGFDMLIFGGLSSSGVQSDNYAYDPDAQAWQGLSESSSRYDHTTVWTGREAVSFGGRTFQQGDVYVTFIGDAELFDYATNRWRKAPGAGAPGARINHSAVWTGSSVIVWGGTIPQSLNSAQFIQLGDGAILE